MLAAIAGVGMATGGPDLFIDDRGAGQAVVLLHGTPSSPEDFEPLVEALARRRRTLVPHAPGYGRTPSPTGPITLPDAAAALERQLLGLGVTSADVVAFSGGAYAAVAMALSRRVRVEKLVLLAPVVGFDAEAAQMMRAIAEMTRSRTYDPRPTWLDRMAAPGFRERDPAGAARVLAWLDSVRPEVLAAELVAAADAPDLRPRLDAVAAETLVCAGLEDRAVPVASSAEIARRIPGAIFRTFERAGHAFLLERPTEVLEVITDFLLRDPIGRDR